MALNSDVQDLLDSTAKNKSLVASLVSGFQALKLANDALQAQLSAMPAASQIDDEDLNAIKAAANDLHDAISQASTAITANTSSAPPADPAAPANP